MVVVVVVVVLSRCVGGPSVVIFITPSHGDLCTVAGATLIFTTA
jgi:hypothetical protein